MPTISPVSDDSRILEFVVRLKSCISERSIDVARANVESLYKHGRLQGSLDGLEEALRILNSVLSDDNEQDME